MKKPRRSKKRLTPVKPGSAYRQMWRIVDGAVADAFRSHPDYLTPRGQYTNCARRSIVKRVTGALLGYAVETARGRSAQPDAAAADKGDTSSGAPAKGAVQ